MDYSSFNWSDSAEIQAVYQKVFTDSEGQSEGVLIGQLVQDMMDNTDEADLFGFVAREQNQIIGCTFYTRLWFDKSLEAFILSPVAVLPSFQGQGIGKTLISYGLGQLAEHNVDLVFTYGDPNYYSKLGFQSITEDLIKAPLAMSQPEGWLCQALNGGEIKPIPGPSRCVEALNKPDYW